MANQFTKITELAKEKLDNVMEYRRKHNVSLAEACQIFGISYSACYRLAKESEKYKDDISASKNGTYNKNKMDQEKRKKILESEKENISRLYNDEKYTFKEIGKLYNTTAVTVMHFCKKHGIKTRDKSAAINLLYKRKPELRQLFAELVYSGKTGYPKNQNRESWCERFVREYLESKNIDFIQEYQINNEGHFYDFKVNDLLIEVDGVYWHNKEKQILKDIEFEKKANEYGFKVIRITDRELKQRGNLVLEEILNGL